MGEAAFALEELDRSHLRFPNGRKPRSEWVKGFTDAEISFALQRLELTAREHMLLERLCKLSLQEGFAWPGQDELKRLVRSCENTLRATTRRLCERGLLQTTLIREGLRYFPQWDVIGLESSALRTAKPAVQEPQNLRMHPLTTKGSKTKSSSREAPIEPPSFESAAAFDDEAESCSKTAWTAYQFVDDDPSWQVLSETEMAEADRELEAYRANSSATASARMSSETPPLPPLSAAPKPPTEPPSPSNPRLAESFRHSKAPELSPPCEATRPLRPAPQRAQSPNPRAKALARPFLHPAHPDVPPTLLNALCALPGGLGALRLLTASRLPRESATRVVERVLAYDQQKGVKHAAKFIRSLIADAVEDLCTRAERSEAKQHDYEPKAGVRRQATVDPELAAFKLRRRDIRGMLVNERSSIMREKLERELAELDASIAARTQTERHSASAVTEEEPSCPKRPESLPPTDSISNSSVTSRTTTTTSSPMSERSSSRTSLASSRKTESSMAASRSSISESRNSPTSAPSAHAPFAPSSTSSTSACAPILPSANAAPPDANRNLREERRRRLSIFSWPTPPATNAATVPDTSSDTPDGVSEGPLERGALLRPS